MTRDPSRPAGDREGTQFLVTRFLSATWFATAFFVVGACGLSLLLGFERSNVIAGTVLALLVTPMIWWSIGRRGGVGPSRGAVAGAIIVPIVWTLALVVCGVATEANRPPDWQPTREWAKFGREFELMLVLFGSVVGAVLGAAYGAMVAWLEQARGRIRARPRVGV